ncbi:hypothetical protein NDN08_004908 [Rhodosorus marinus]|uniref:GAG-pre-integrase domain-containing protein n=1 Tax=Rhodosorus marinus TaxID=101924 RepID=A0AAV8UIF1_9RHOD|nr:hypothetical protein NDN08_004908 [Rhodosorus marinus]
MKATCGHLDLRVVLSESPHRSRAIQASTAHKRFGLQGQEALQRMKKEGVVFEGEPPRVEECEACTSGKMRGSLKGHLRKSITPGETCHSDVCGPLPAGMRQERFIIVFMD